MIWRCNLLPQYKLYKKELDQAIARVLNSGKYILGDEVRNFEHEFAQYFGVKYAIGVANGTDALILSMKTLDIGPGDEVITTPFTAIPTSSAIIMTGATPVFVDIDPDTFLIDIEKVGSAITKKTKAIIPVHIFGNVVNVQKLRKIVGKKIAIIEDACQAHGSKIGTKYAGTIGDLGTFSFYPTKNIGGYGDGGMITTNNSKLTEKIKLLRMYGMVDKDHIVINGGNSRLDELQAAILTVKLKYLNQTNQKRQVIAKRYIRELNPNLFIHQKVPNGVYHNYHLFESRYLGDRNRLVQYMDKLGIQTNIYYPVPLHLQKANKFLGYKAGQLPNCKMVCKQAIAFPMYPELTEKDLNYVIKSINAFE